MELGFSDGICQIKELIFNEGINISKLIKKSYIRRDILISYNFILIFVEALLSAM